MTGLIEMVAKNPAIAETIAKQLGMDVRDTGSVIEKLAPILMGGAKSNLNSDKDSGGLLKHVEQNTYAQMLDKPEAHINNGDFKSMGNDILAELTGSKENSREVAKHVESETGISSTLVKNVLPMLAPLIIGALTKKSAPSLANNRNEGSNMTDFLSGLIDQDNDGSAIDDIMGMAAKFIFK